MPLSDEFRRCQTIKAALWPDVVVIVLGVIIDLHGVALTQKAVVVHALVPNGPAAAFDQSVVNRFAWLELAPLSHRRFQSANHCRCEPRDTISGETSSPELMI